VVSDTAYRPLAGATVDAIDGAGAGASVTTGAAGQFAMTGPFDATTRFRASHRDHWSETLAATPAGPSWLLHFRLAPDAPSLDMSGRYRLAIAADATCTGLPAFAAARDLAVVATRDGARRGLFHLDAPGTALLHGYAWEGFSIGVAADVLAIGGGNLHGDPGLVEQVGSDSYLAFDGTAEGTASAGGSTILDAAFQGFIEYCGLPPGSPVPIVDGRYRCPVDARVRCFSSRHRLTLSRK
jgi:hypothetical protein